MKTVRRAIRMVLLIAHLLAGVVLAFLLGGDGMRERRQRARRWWFTRLCRLLGLELRITGRPVAGPALFVANHISWLDIPVLGALAPLSFLSKAEVRRWPVIGPLAARVDTIFIERGGRDAATTAAGQIAAALSGETAVAIFPEAMTTDGREVRRFHPRLFAAAIEAGRPVQPVALRYLDCGGHPHPLAPFIGDDRFLAHLWRMLGGGRMAVEVGFCPVIEITDSNDERRRLAGKAHGCIVEMLGGAGDGPANDNESDGGEG